MGNIKVEAGDFVTGKHSNFSAMFGINTFEMALDEFAWTSSYKILVYPADEVEELEEASEENVKRIGGTVGWGIAGAALLGPVGLLAGLIVGGRGKNVTFICRFKDGKKFLGTTDSKTFTKIRASQF